MTKSGAIHFGGTKRIGSGALESMLPSSPRVRVGAGVLASIIAPLIVSYLAEKTHDTKGMAGIEDAVKSIDGRRNALVAISPALQAVMI